MGQRLSIHIIQQDKIVANAYYPWSGYTMEALALTQQILSAIKQADLADEGLQAVRLLEETGAKMNTEERVVCTTKYPAESFTYATGEEEGLIAITEDGIHENYENTSTRVEIRLDEQLVNFDVFWQADKEDYMEDFGLTEDDYQQLPKSFANFTQIPIPDFENLARVLTEWKNAEVPAIQIVDEDEVLLFIE